MVTSATPSRSSIVTWLMRAFYRSAIADALEIYARAGETRDADLAATAFADDGRLRSPVFGSFVIRGRDDIRTLLGVVYSVARQTEFTRRMRNGNTGMLTARGRVGGVRLEEAFVFDLDENGLIKVVTVHMRPLFGLAWFAFLVGPRMARHPGVLLRAMRG